MGDSRLLLGCVKCGKAEMICRLSLGYEAWVHPSNPISESYTNVYGKLLDFMNAHIQSECAYSEKEGNAVETSRDIFRLAIEEECYYSEKHGWILGDYVEKYDIERDEHAKKHWASVLAEREKKGYKLDELLRETNMIQRYDNGTGDCVSSFCDGKVELATGKVIHPCDPECWFERVNRRLKKGV